MTNPSVTIGLPVFNGENFLEKAIGSVLAQEYRDFELIIRDNASSDRTEQIGRSAAASDPRIQYIRSPENLGAAPNFNAILPLARGRYFKWLAHDDMMAPSFLSRCIEALEQNPDCVLACPRIRFVDADGQPIEDYVSPFDTGNPDPNVRFRETLHGHRCFEVFGVIRLAELRKTRLIGSYKHGDGVLLSHLALLGRFAEVPEYLFLSRRHEGQSMYVYGITNARAKEDHEAYARWFDVANARKAPLNFTRRLGEYRWMIAATRLSLRRRLGLYRSVFDWALSQRYRIRKEWAKTLQTRSGRTAQ